MGCRDYVVENLQTLTHPFNGDQIHPYNDLPSLAILFERLLAQSENQSLGMQVDNAIAQHQSLPFGATTDRLATLRSIVGTVEPVLKALGRITHASNQERLLRLEQTMLKGLLEQGLVLSPITWDQDRSGLKHDPIYWAQQDFLTSMAYSVWRLRNDMAHGTPMLAPDQISRAFNSTLGFLLLVLQYPSNRTAVASWTSPYRGYLDWAGQHLDIDYDRYVPLNMVLRWSPDLSNDVFLSPGLESENLIPRGPISLVSLINEVDRFVLVGGAGAGKSRSLRHMGAQLARDAATRGATFTTVPLFLMAFTLITEKSLPDALSHLQGSTDPEEVRSALNEGRYVVIIDALNEIGTNDYRHVIQLLKSFVATHPRCRLVVSSRPETYHNELPLPVYELQYLARNEVREILQRYAQDRDAGDRLFGQIITDGRLLALFRTPLLGRLLCELPPNVRIPRSLGEMMGLLFDRLFEREQQKGEPLRPTVAEFVLSRFATVLREAPGNVLPEATLLSEASAEVHRYDSGTSAARLLEQLLGSGILERDSGSRIGFFHETALDYYLALSYRATWTSGIAAPREERALPPTATATEILAGLLTSPDDLVRTVAASNIQLAAQSYSARSHRSVGLYRELVTMAITLLDRDAPNDQSRAIRALAAFDEADATKILFNRLPHLSPKLQRLAQEVLVTQSPSGSAEQALSFLRSGSTEQRVVALQLVGRMRLVDAVPLVIDLADQGRSELSVTIADTLGRMDIDNAQEYLMTQTTISPEKRSIPLDVAIAALSPSTSSALLMRAMHDPDVRVRRAAVARCETTEDVTLFAKVQARLEEDLDFEVRLIAATLILNSGGGPSHVEIVRSVFGGIVPQGAGVPASAVFRFIDALPLDAHGEALMQGLCYGDPSVQALVSKRVVRRTDPLALTFLDLVNLSDPAITTAAKMTLVDAAINQAGQVETVFDRIFVAGVPDSVRETAVIATLGADRSLVSIALKYALADSVPRIRSCVPKLLAHAPELLSDDLVTTLINDESEQVRRSVYRLLAKPSLFPDQKLYGLCDKKNRLDVRAAAVSALFARGYRFPLSLAHTLRYDSDIGLRKFGHRILKAMFRDDLEHVGLVEAWKVERYFGFIKPLDKWTNVFFHWTGLQDPTYEPAIGDLVRFNLGTPSMGHDPPATSVELVSRSPQRRL